MLAAEQHGHPHGIPAPFETFLWLALRRGTIFGAVGLHAFLLPSQPTLHVKRASWHQTQGIFE